MSAGITIKYDRHRRHLPYTVFYRPTLVQKRRGAADKSANLGLIVIMSLYPLQCKKAGEFI